MFLCKLFEKFINVGRCGDAVPRLFLGGCLIILKFLLFLFRKYRLPDVFYCNYYFRFVVAVG